MAQLVASMSGVVLGGVVEVVGSNLARGKIFTASFTCERNRCHALTGTNIRHVLHQYQYIYIYILYRLEMCKERCCEIIVIKKKNNSDADSGKCEYVTTT